jgi:hypothetical protein
MWQGKTFPSPNPKVFGIEEKKNHPKKVWMDVDALARTLMNENSRYELCVSFVIVL